MNVDLLIVLLLTFEYFNVAYGLPIAFSTKNEQIMEWIIDSTVISIVVFFGGVIFWIAIYPIRKLLINKTNTKDKKKNKCKPSLDELINEVNNRLEEIYPFIGGGSLLFLTNEEIAKRTNKRKEYYRVREGFKIILNKYNEIYKTDYSDLISQSERNMANVVGTIIGMDSDTIKATENELLDIINKCDKLFDKIINEIELRDEKVNELIKKN